MLVGKICTPTEILLSLSASKHYYYFSRHCFMNDSDSGNLMHVYGGVRRETACMCTCVVSVAHKTHYFLEQAWLQYEATGWAPH